MKRNSTSREERKLLPLLPVCGTGYVFLLWHKHKAGGLTFPCQELLPGATVFLEGGQQCCFWTHRCSVTSGVSISIDPSSIPATVGSAHFVPCQACRPGWVQNDPASFCLATVARIPHVFRFSCPGNSNGCLSHSNLWFWRIHFRHHNIVSFGRF